MRIKIDGRTLRVVQTPRLLDELQQQTGWTLNEFEERSQMPGVGLAIAAWFALRNAGHEPSFAELYDADSSGWEVLDDAPPVVVQETVPDVVPDPPSFPAASAPVAVGARPISLG